MKKKIYLITGILIAALTFTACGAGSKKTAGKNEKTSIDTMSEDEQEKIYEKLFDINSKVSIDIDVSDEELQKIQDDYEKYSYTHSKSPIYRRADKVTITIDDDKYELDDVGIRMKGNMSRTDFYDEKKGGIYNLIHFKLSFDEAFDNEEYYGDDAEEWKDSEKLKERKARTFATLDKLEVKWNKNYDNAYVRQSYSYEMFRNFGVIAPKNSFAQVMRNGENYGVFMIGETVDKKFIERNFDEEDQGGDLYKASWTFKPANYTKQMTYGINNPDENKFYNLDLKTNKKTSQNEKLENMLNVLNGENVTKEDLEKVIDMDNFVKFAAVSYFLGNPDDLRNNYNNHYIYFLKSSGKAVFIPYDYDRTLGITHSYNPEYTGMTEVSPFSEYAEGNGSSQANPLYKYTILSNGYFIDEYKKSLAEIASSGWMQPQRIESEYETVRKNYEDVAVIDKKFENLENDRLEFSLDGEFNYGDDEYNMSVSEYMSRILDTYNSAIDK